MFCIVKSYTIEIKFMTRLFVMTGSDTRKQIRVATKILWRFWGGPLILDP